MTVKERLDIHKRMDRNIIHNLSENPDYTFQVITDKGTLYIGADKKKQVYTAIENEDCEIKRLVRLCVNFYE